MPNDMTAHDESPCISNIPNRASNRGLYNHQIRIPQQPRSATSVSYYLKHQAASASASPPRTSNGLKYRHARIHTHPLTRRPMAMDAVRKKRMFQRLSRSQALIRVQRQTPLEQVHKVVQLSALRVIHAGRRGQEARPQIPRRLDAGKGPDVCLRERKAS